ncbi:D-alanine--D-alanine ligase [Granulicella sp. 5B5]|uniref:D-alanine--D-alanine ligase family protein n=1 Tax=Granulicella sp. 5B5 TaxID=1617967 RepID=UPI0015F7694D|nr:D-alanine--D-alanine ligase family protein [Granulicella sp. 5B5]QMV18799.1 D-alanine--D-alanine ligase [Granulicella sp. 5B5]
MATKKLRVGILFGGKSGEHEISLRSARSILEAISRRKYDVVELGIDKQGRWLQSGEALKLLGSPGAEAVHETGLSIAAAAAEPAVGTGLDLVFPVLHGTFGEDGTIQGLFELADIAYVGSGVLGSAAGMDKDAMKRMFFAAGLPITPHVTLLRSQWKVDPKKCIRSIERALQYPVFVKPANLGSSVGISKVKSRKDLVAAMDLAASFDRKIVIEQGVGGPGVKPRELEVAVLGNDDPEASVVGEIIPAKEFYDYEAKYELNGADESVSIIPAKLTKAESSKIRKMAINAFRACDCAGLARVDFLMAPAKKGKPAEIVLNEINTLPGFTSISMYPKLWAASGISYPKLIDRLIELALERHREKQQTHFSR